MMNEDKRKEAQKKLEDEERVRRLQEGGETMKAELAMEEAQRSSQDVKGRDYLTPQEQKRREMLESKGPYRGYGESQQAEMAMWEAQRGQEVTGERYAKEVRGETRGSMTKEEMRRTGSDQVGFPAGSGSFYSETGEKPTGIAGPEGSFGRSGHMPSGKQYAEGGLGAGRPSERNLSQEEMRRTGSDQVNYPAGSGSFYSETGEKPTGIAGPEGSFGRSGHMPSGREYAEKNVSEQEIQQGRMGARPTVETAAPGKMGQATGMVKEKGGAAMEKGKEYGNVAMSKGKEVSSTFVSKTKAVTSDLTGKAKEFNESNRAEDIAGRAGETLGRVIRRTAAVAKEMTEGFRRGIGREEEKRREEERAGPASRESVQQEEYVKESPTTEEKTYREVKKKENM
jgi:hypothetical protein